MDFEKAIRPLGRFTPMLEKVPQAVRDAVFDIRISVDKPVLLCCRRPHFVFAGRRRHGAVFFAKPM